MTEARRCESAAKRMQPGEGRTTTHRLGCFISDQFLPIGLVSVAVLGILAPMPGLFMARFPTQYVAVGIIFVCAGLRLRTEEIRTAVSAWRASSWGVVSVLLVTPVIGALLAARVPVDPVFRTGLALFFCMPTTLSSGIALTGQARGNVALALLLTVSTNLIGIVTVPLVLARLLGMLGDAQLSAGALTVKLLLSVLLPLACGKLLRRWVYRWVDSHRPGIRVLSNVALISVPWMKFSQSSAQLAQIAALSLVTIVAAGIGVHLVFLAVNAGAAYLLRLNSPEAKAVVLLASQKTLPVALTVLAFLPVPLELKGLIAIPCITSHLGQIFVDALVATRWGTARVAAAARQGGPPVAE